MNPTYDFTGRVAFVTGAGSGMGLATARAFAQAGAAVTLADVNDAQLDAAERKLRDSGHRALAMRDVADEDQVAAAVATTVQRSAASTWPTPGGLGSEVLAWAVRRVHVGLGACGAGC
jgi:NAD(P)-dependent dehydrogenase (short-subunit alcohol dehydrogenase family)